MLGKPLGTEHVRMDAPRPRDILGNVRDTASGNIVLEIGHELEHGGLWTKSGHIVLTPTEASVLGSLLIALADETLDGLARPVDESDPARTAR